MEACLHAFLILTPNKNNLIALHSGSFIPSIIVRCIGVSRDGVNKMDIRNVSGSEGNQNQWHGCPERGPGPITTLTKSFPGSLLAAIQFRYAFLCLLLLHRQTALPECVAPHQGSTKMNWTYLRRGYWGDYVYQKRNDVRWEQRKKYTSRSFNICIVH